MNRSSSLSRLSLVAGLSFLPVLGLSAHDLYWTESEVIMGADIDGENATVVFDGTGMESNAVDILVTDDHLYWTDNGGAAAEIWRAGRDGSNPERITDDSDIQNPHFMVLDEANDHIYFTALSRGLFRIDLDGGNVEWVYDHNDAWGHEPENYTGIILVGPGEPRVLDSLFRLHHLRDDLIAEVVAELPGSGATYGIAYDEGTQTVYYTTYGGGELWSYNLQMEEGALLRTGLREPLGVKLSPSRTHLLIAERGRGVSAFQIDNFGYELLMPSSDAHFGVAVTADPADLPPGEDPADLPFLFRANFENDDAGEPPVTEWASFGTPDAGTATVIQDTENVFGAGTDNQFLRVESVSNLNFQTTFEGTDVLTLSFDFIGRVNEPDGNRHINVNLRSGSTNDDRVHLTQLRMWNGTVPPDNHSYGGNNLPIRLDTVVNNSTETLTYDRPDGEGTADLSPGMASLWIYHYLTETWDQMYVEYENVRHDSVDLGDEIVNLWFQADSDDRRRSYDLDNVYVFEGAVPGELLREADVQPPVVPYPEEPILVVHDDFNHTEVTSPEVERIDPEDYQGPLSLSYHSSTEGILRIVEDAENHFGRGTDNQVLYIEELNGLRLNAFDHFDSGVMTYSFEMHHTGAFSDQGTDALWSRFWADGPGVTTVSDFTLEEADVDQGTYAVSGIPGQELSSGVTHRFTLIVNNTWDEITYASPAGQQSLESGMSVLWVDGSRFAEPSDFGSQAIVPDTINAFQLSTSSGGYWTGYLDNIRLWEGAIIPDFEPSEGYADWTEQYFPGETDPAIVGPDSDPDGDGVRNLVEYALGLDPTSPNRDGLPSFGVEEIGGEDYLTLTYSAPDNVDDVFYTVEAGSELGELQEEAIHVDSVDDPARAGHSLHTYRDSEPITVSDRRFIQLTVEMQ